MKDNVQMLSTKTPSDDPNQRTSPLAGAHHRIVDKNAFKNEYSPVLRFAAKIEQENSLNSSHNIIYFPETDQWMVLEEERINEHTPSLKRKLFKKQRVENQTLEDLVLTMRAKLGGNYFKILHCDRFTRNFLRASGIECNNE